MVNVDSVNVDSVSWTRVSSRGEEQITPGSYSYYHYYNGGTKQQPSLTVRQVTADRDGEYKCTATNDFGSNSAETILTAGGWYFVLSC